MNMNIITMMAVAVAVVATFEFDDLIVSKEEHVYYIYKNNLFAIFFV